MSVATLYFGIPRSPLCPSRGLTYQIDPVITLWVLYLCRSTDVFPLNRLPVWSFPFDPDHIRHLKIYPADHEIIFPLLSRQIPLRSPTSSIKPYSTVATPLPCTYDSTHSSRPLGCSPNAPSYPSNSFHLRVLLRRTILRLLRRKTTSIWTIQGSIHDREHHR